MADLFLTRTLRGFEPSDAAAAEYHKALKIGQTVRATVKIPRSGPHHRLIFALLQLCYQNLPEKYAELWRSFDQFRKAIALEAGHVEIIKRRDGEIVQVPGSLSFDALDEREFTKVAGAMMSICAALLDMVESELAAEVSRYSDASYGRMTA